MYTLRFKDVAELRNVLEDTFKAHHTFETSTGIKDQDWAGWYAKYILGSYADSAFPMRRDTTYSPAEWKGENI